MSWELDGWDLDPGKPATRKLTGAHNLGWLPGGRVAFRVYMEHR
jgi:hypothetical protein